MHGRSTGFTLIELMVVLAIAAILWALAWPSYGEHVSRSRRAQAALDLMQASQYLQRYYAASNTYTGAALLEGLARSPHDGDVVAYAITAATDDDGLGFTLSAVPQGRWATDRCGTLVLRSTGQRSNAAGQPLDSCWR